MKARALLLTAFLGSALWLLFSESGKRRRGQLMGLMGRGPASDDAQSSATPAVPLQFPQSPPREGPAEPSQGATAATGAVTPEAVAPVAPAPAAPPAEASPSSSVAPPTPEEAQPGPLATEQVGNTPSPTTGPDGTSVQVEEVTDGQEAEPNARLEEVLQELVEEIETHAIGQEADVKVEEELDQATLQEIGVPAQTPAETAQPETPAEPAPADTRWVGNRRKMIAHAPGGGRLPAQENRVYFDTREEAAAAGYRIVEHEEH